MTKGAKSLVVLGAVCFTWFAFMLVFRAFIYADMYKAPEDPYGISDILEYFMWVVFIALLSLAVVTSIILMIRGITQTKMFAAGLIVFCVVLFFSFSSLHSIAARW